MEKAQYNIKAVFIFFIALYICHSKHSEESKNIEI